MPRPPPVTSAWEEGDNGVIGQASWIRGSAYILNFKLLQGSGRARGWSGLLAETSDFVGWAERSDTHQRRYSWAMGIASLHPSYTDMTSRSRGALRPRFAW